MISLRNIAKDKGLRQKDIADRIGRSVPTISQWFNRATTIPTQYIVPLAEVLGLDPAQVLEVAVMLPPPPPEEPEPELTTCPTCGMLRAAPCAPQAEAA